MSPIVRAIDVGYGNTKFVVFHQTGKDVQCSLFPSVAPQAGSGPDLTGGVFQKRNTVAVDVSGVRYEVGKDAKLAQDASYGRVLDAAFSLTDTYMALVRGAMYYMGVPHIDVLVLGLPVNTYAKYHDDLARRMTGVHRIPDPNDPRSGHTIDIEVRATRVIPQPIGGFFDHAIRNNLYGRLKNQMNLLIDPGYYTLDWVVAQGVKMIDTRSGAHSGGMSSILGSMAESISREIGTQIADVSIIDDALRMGTSPRFFGKEFDMKDQLKVAKEKARQFVSVLANKVGHGGLDIDNIILAGGGAQFFLEVVQEQFPKHEISVTQEPVFANVRGFQFAGEQYAQSSAFNASRAA